MILDRILGRKKEQPQQQPQPQVGAAARSFVSGGYSDLSSAGLTAEDVTYRPYRYNPWVYRCVSAYQRELAHLRRILVARTDNTKVISDAHLLDLLRRPNPYMTGTQFFQALIAYLLIPYDASDAGGQCFVVPWSPQGKVDLAKSPQKAKELYVYPGRYFSPITETTPTGLTRLTGWKMHTMSGIELAFAPTEVIRIVLVDPYSPYTGASPYLAAQLAVLTDARGDEWSANVIANDCTPSCILTTDAQYMTEEQANRMLERWIQKQTGPKNARKIALLWGGVKFQQTALTPRDMDWERQKQDVRSKIIAAYGLNRIAIGDYEQINYATMKEGRKYLWHDAFIPLDRIINEAFTEQFQRYVDDKYELQSDYSTVEALRDDVRMQAEVLATMVQSGAPFELAARIAGVKLTADDLERWPALSHPPLSFPPANPYQTAPAAHLDKEESRGVLSVSRDEARKACARYIDQFVLPQERAFAADLRRYFTALRNSIEDAVDEWAQATKSAGAGITRAYADAEQFLAQVSEEEWYKRLMEIYRVHVWQQAQRETEACRQELGRLVVWNLSKPVADKYVSARAAFLREISSRNINAHREAIIALIKESMEKEWTVADTAKRLHQAIRETTGIALNNTPTIARTEMGSIVSMERHDIFRAEGIDMWEWVTHIDEVTRVAHIARDGQRRRVGELFAPNLRFPRDIGAPADEVINCRCVCVAVRD